MYYKVTSPNLRSYLDDKYQTWDLRLPVKFNVQYKLNEWVNGDKLFVFSCLNQAKEFCGWTNRSYFFPVSEYRIFECEVKNPQPISLIIPWVILYECKDSVPDWVTYTSPPKNTRVCDAVKLVKELQIEKNIK